MGAVMMTSLGDALDVKVKIDMTKPAHRQIIDFFMPKDWLDLEPKERADRMAEKLKIMGHQFSDFTWTPAEEVAPKPQGNA